MQVGKLTPAALQQLIFDRLGKRRREVVLRGSLGEDSAALDLSGDLCVLSTDPITGAAKHAGWLAVHVSCNDVATNGAEPVAVLLTLLLPAGSDLSLVQEIMTDAERAAQEVSVEIVGGHTEFTAAVNQPVICTTVLGRAPRARLATSASIHPGDALVATKYVGVEGTAILAWDYANITRPLLGDELWQAALKLQRLISVVPEARIAAELGVRAMHDVTEGGVLGAAYEMAGAAGLGFKLEEASLLLHPATERLVQHLQFDPLRLISSGTLLLATSKPEPLLAALKAQGIPASVIGHFHSGEAKQLIKKDGEVVEVQPPESDELWRLQAQLQKPAGDQC